MTVLRWIPLCVIGLCFIAYLALPFASEPIRAALWYLSQLSFYVFGFVFTLTVLIYLIVKKRWKSRLVWGSLITALIALVLPVYMSIPVFGLRYPARIETSTPSLSVRLPLDEPVRVLHGGDRVKQNYHAAYPDQRWAYDLGVDPVMTESASVEDYGCFGKTILAPITGHVKKAYDGDEDQVPSIDIIAPENVSGNYVIITPENMDASYELHIAHMKKGSLRVMTGDEVVEGQAIGQCGNSGNTTEPHIHIHFQKRWLTPSGTAIETGLPLYFRDHDGEAMPQGGIRIDWKADDIFPDGDIVTHQSDKAVIHSR